MAASKKPAAKKSTAKKTTRKPAEKVTLTPAEQAKRKRKQLFLELIDHGLPVPKELRDEFAPSEDDTPDEPVDAYDADAERSTAKARIIRNLRQTPVHLRLSQGTEQPFRVALSARGSQGDVAYIPAKCTEDTAFNGSYNAGLFEIITNAERAAIDYAAPSREVMLDPTTGTTVTRLPTEAPGDNVAAEYGIETVHEGMNAGQVTKTDVIAPRDTYVPGADPALLKAADGLSEGQLSNGGNAGSTAMPGTVPQVVRD